MSTADEDSVARRAFLGKVAAGTLAMASAPLLAASAKLPNAADDDPWLKMLTGKHNAVFDAPVVNDGFPLMFAATYLNTMKEHYKLLPGDISAMVARPLLLHHTDEPFACATPQSCR